MVRPKNSCSYRDLSRHLFPLQLSHDFGGFKVLPGPSNAAMFEQRQLSAWFFGVTRISKSALSSSISR